MSSPFTILRRNQKSILAVSGILIMFVFVVGDYIGRQRNDDHRGRDTSGETLVRWSGGSASETELHRALLVHRYTLQFLSGIIQETIENKGTPRVRNVNRESPGITPAQDLQGIFQKRILAAKAAQMGIVVSDEAVLEFLEKLSDGLLKHDDFQRLLGKTLGATKDRRVTPQQVFHQLKEELAGENLVQLVNSGMGAQTPVAAWTNFNRLNRRVKLEALPLKVDDYKAQVKQEPKDAELKELFEKHKADYGHPQIPTPGFRQWKQVAFQYYKVDFDKFLAEELPQVTDEEIQKEYDEGVTRGEYRVQELPPTNPGTKLELPKAEADDQKPENKKPEDKKDEKKDEKKSDEVKPQPSLEAPKTNADKPEEKKPAPATEVKPDAPKTETPKTETPKPESAKEEKKDEKKDGSSSLSPPSRNRVPTFFVSTADEKGVEAVKATEKVDEKKDTPAPPKTEPAKPAAETKPAESKPADTKPAEPAKEEPKKDEKPDTKPVDSKPATDAKPDEKKLEEKKDEEKKEEKPKVKPLAEVKDEVVKRIAKPKAQEAKKKVIAELRRQLTTYGRDRRVWEKFKNDKDPPAEPKIDLEALAESLKVIYGKTELLTQVTAADHELGKLVSLFSQKAFQNSELPLYQPQEPEFEEDLTFIWWKTEEKPEKVPEFKEAREAVIDAWKRAQALKLAQKDAEEKIKAAKGKASFKEIFGDAVVETNSFSWMTGGNVAWGFGMPTMSAVDKIESPGAEFMQKVFECNLGDVGTALNNPQSIVYVFRIAEEATKESDRREMFLTSGNSFAVRSLWFGEHRQALNQWYQDLEKEMHVMWRDRPMSSESDEE